LDNQSKDNQRRLNAIVNETLAHRSARATSSRLKGRFERRVLHKGSRGSDEECVRHGDPTFFENGKSTGRMLIVYGLIAT